MYTNQKYGNYQKKRSNFNMNSSILRHKELSSMNIQPFNKFSSRLSHLPVRSKSKSLTDKNVKIKNHFDSKRQTTSLSTRSNFSPYSDILKSYPNSGSKLKSLSKICTKVELLSKNQTVTRLTRCFNMKQSRNILKAKIPVNRNNSSCEKLTSFNKKFKSIKQNFSNYEMIKDINSEKKFELVSQHESQHSKKSNEKHNTCPISIFRLFKMKIEMYREKHKIVDNKTGQEYKSFDNPFSRYFLLKLYNECKKLNGNIVKLTKDNPEFRSRLKSTCIEQNSSNKFQNSLSDLNETSNLKCNSTIFLSSKTLSNENISDKKSINKRQRSQSNYISTGRITKTRDENNGHYYHLACVLSSDPERANSSNNYGKSVNEEVEESVLSKIICKENHFETTDVNFDIVSNKLKSSTSSKSKINNLLNIPKQKCHENNFHQNDDTLFNLDDNMSTDSLEDVKIITKDINSPVSCSNYLTANENCKAFQENPNNGTNKLKTESASSYDMPPAPSLKYTDTIIDTQSTLPDNNPTDFKDSFVMTKPINMENASHLPVSQFVAIFEKQFPQQMVLINSKSDDSKQVTDNQETTKFTSSLTINCYKDNGRNIKRSFQKPKGSLSYFNPFKPPKSNSFKLTPFLNSNNNNSSGSEEKSNLTDNLHEIKSCKINPTHVNKIEFVEEEKEPVAKRIAPLKELLMHSRNSDKMNFVFTDPPNESKTDHSNNSYIEKQRQKKIMKQKEQHQKAKDMAIEAARLRKERQAEIQSFDSFDSSRIIERLFTENETNYPEFSLYDACHYNFIKKRSAKPKPLAQSTITGILPEEPEQLPEPPKSPVTNEKFRKEPISFTKRVRVKKEFTKKELEKYEPVGNFKTTSTPEIVLKQTEKIEILSTRVETNKTNNKQKINEIPSVNHLPSSTSSSNEDLTISSISSHSSDTTSPSVNETSSSSESSIRSIKVKRKHENFKNHTKSLKGKSHVVDKNQKPQKIKHHSKKDAKNSISHETENNSKLQNNKLENDTKMDKVNSSKNKDIRNLAGKKSLKSEVNKYDDDFKINEEPKKISQNTNDASVSTDLDHNFNKQNFMDKSLSSSQITENDIFEENDLKGASSNTNVCHLNHQRNYNENLIDRNLTFNIKVPISDTSLSAFVQELNSQLHSLADTVDILENRMECFESNLLDSSKYFVYK